ncbi:DUF6929 family protein [Pontibacter ruber]|uniref:DUF6929 family protein n=1 Tax=Pontibacter ruber TaxID=1343895 RepID=A0ABW5D261_9BACT|nr:hypothetical protein [Pontibacter ruber]
MRDTTTASAIIQRKITYERLPSASAMEQEDGTVFILGDDSPYLYQLDEQFKQTGKIALFDTSGLESGRIPKSKKPDLESMASIEFNGNKYLLMLGSGSSKPRHTAYLVQLPVQSAAKPQIRKVDLTPLYKHLQDRKEVVGEDVLNIEGMAIGDGHVFLLHRATGKGFNVLLRYDTDPFASFLLEGKEAPAPDLYFFKLPELEQYQAGFSGAYLFEDKLFFTASVESTTNAIDDGEVLGSFVGAFPLSSLPKATDPAKPFTLPAAIIKDKEDKTYLGKAESLVVKGSEQQGKYKILVVTDDDKGHSELLEIEAAL